MNEPASDLHAGTRRGPWARFERAHLQDYNRPATRLWLAIAGAGLLAVALAVVDLAQLPSSDLWQVLGWTVVAVLAAAFPIQIPRSKHSLATGDVVIFLLLALYGAPAATVAAAVECLVASARTSARVSSRVASPSRQQSQRTTRRTPLASTAFQPVSSQRAQGIEGSESATVSGDCKAVDPNPQSSIQIASQLARAFRSASASRRFSFLV